MHIVFRHIWQLVVHHIRQLVNVQTTRGDIGGHQHAHTAIFKVIQRTGTRTLTLVTVNRCSGDAIFTQLLGQMVGTVLGTGKHQHLTPLIAANQKRQQFALTLTIDKVHTLLNLLGSSVTASHFNQLWVFQQFVCQTFDLIREGRGEQQVLTLGRQQRQHFTDIVDKAHIQHAVSFIQHQCFHFCQRNGVLLNQIQQTAWRGYQNINPTTQLDHLRVNAHATEYHQRAQRQVFAIFAYVFPYLSGQLTGRRQDQRLNWTTAIRLSLLAQAL